jgi:PEP-CTERM motif
MRNRFLLGFGLTLGVLLSVSSSVKADSFTASEGWAPTVNITYDASSNNPTSVRGVLPVPFSVTDRSGPQLPVNMHFTAFCVDLWHGFGTSFSGNLASLTSSSNLPPLAPGYTATSGLVNELNYLGTVYATISSGHMNSWKLQDAYGGLQLAIWSLIDQKGQTGYRGFSFSGGDTSMIADYTSIIKALGGTVNDSSGVYSASGLNSAPGGTRTNKVEGQTIANYSTASPPSPYAAATILTVTSGNRQNMISFPGGGVPPFIVVGVPEPSTMAIAGLGAMGMIAYGWKPRKRG